MTALIDPAEMAFREAAAPYLFDAVPEALVVLNAAGVMTGVNAHAERMIGLPASRLVGDRLTVFLRLVGGEPAARVLSHDSVAGTAGDRGTPAICRHASGRDVQVEMRCAPVTTAAGAGTVESIHAARISFARSEPDFGPQTSPSS